MSTKADRFKDRHKRLDPHFNDVPYEIVEHKGEVVGEVFTLPTHQLVEGWIKREKKHETTQTNTL